MSYYNRNVFFLFSDLSGDLEMLAFPSVKQFPILHIKDSH